MRPASVESSEVLREKASWVWRETLKLHRRAPETRLASSLSSVEIFTVLYYGNILRYDPAQPFWPERDRCIISKGHGSICMYPILADLGFFPAAELERICQDGSFLGGIPDPVIPGYETVNGSLGHGAGVGAGIALALKRLGVDRRVFVVLGDGELHEGANWEAIMFAAHHCLDNLIFIVDDNGTSMLGRTPDIVSHRSLAAKFEAFGWLAEECLGHCTSTLQRTIQAILAAGGGQPRCVIAKTVKGHGVPALEASPLSHVMTVSRETIDHLAGDQP